MIHSLSSLREHLLVSSVFFIVTAFLLINIPSVHAIGGIGISPSIITEDGLVRGNEYTRFIRVLNLDDATKNVTISITGDGASYVSLIDNQTGALVNGSLMIASESTRFLQVVFTIPTDAPNGIYQGTIELQPLSVNQSVSLVVSGVYRFVVTGTETRRGAVASIVVQNTEAGQPLRIQYDFTNKGNVRVAPVAQISILKDGQIIDNFTRNGSTVAAGDQATQVVEWSTENQGTGNFSAKVRVLLDTTELETQESPFALAGRGTYTADVLPGEMSMPLVWEIGKLEKMTMPVYNVGKIDVLVKVTTEVQKDGELKDVVTSDERLIKAGAQETLTMYYKAAESGSYVMNSTLLFSGKQKSLDDLRFSAKSKEELSVNRNGFTEDSTFSYSPLMLVGGVVILFVIMIIVIMVSRSKKRR